MLSHSRVFSWATIFAPAWPSAKFDPTRSGCQCVLNRTSIPRRPHLTPHELEQLRGAGFEAAVDERDAGGAARSDDVAAGAREHRETRAEPLQR